MVNMLKSYIRRIYKKHKYQIIVGLCWTPLWLVSGYLAGHKDLAYIIIQTVICWTGYAIVIAVMKWVHMVNKFMNKSQDIVNNLQNIADRLKEILDEANNRRKD